MAAGANPKAAIAHGGSPAQHGTGGGDRAGIANAGLVAGTRHAHESCLPQRLPAYLPMPSPVRYLASLRPAMVVLWCYLIWYLVTVCHHFDPTPRLWLNSLGISALIGTALVLSVGRAALHRAGRWSVLRLYLMPFGVSSFAALIKDKGFMLVVAPGAAERLEAIGACAAFVLLVMAVKAWPRAQATDMT